MNDTKETHLSISQGLMITLLIAGVGGIWTGAWKIIDIARSQGIAMQISADHSGQLNSMESKQNTMLGLLGKLSMQIGRNRAIIERLCQHDHFEPNCTQAYDNP
jgi:hypothetical protein